MENKSICKLLWMHLATDTSGQIKPCCVYDGTILNEAGQPYNLGYDSLSEIYNSPGFVNIRQDMLDAKMIPGCSHCYNQEDAGIKSYRQMYNDLYNGTITNTSKSDTNIRYLDLRFGNLCNLSCRSCSPEASSQLANEVAEISGEMLKYHTLPKQDNNAWYQTEIFAENLNSQIENLDTVYITGGEPTIIKQNLDLLEKLIASGRSNEIMIKMNSNLTNINQRLIEMLKHFKSVLILASIDGYGKMQEYLRFPSKWDTIDYNLKRLLGLGSNIVVSPSPVIQATNLGKLVELFDYFEDFNRQVNSPVINIAPIFLRQPDRLNLTYLPIDYKLRCWDRIQQWLDTVQFQSPSFHSQMEELKNNCRLECSPQETVRYMKEYVDYNSLFDRRRRASLIDVNPELHEVLSKLL